MVTNQIQKDKQNSYIISPACLTNKWLPSPSSYTDACMQWLCHLLVSCVFTFELGGDVGGREGGVGGERGSEGEGGRKRREDKGRRASRR